MRAIVRGILILLIGSAAALTLIGSQAIEVVRTLPDSILFPLIGIFPTPSVWLTRILAEGTIGVIVGSVLALVLRARARRAALHVTGQPGRAALIGLGAWFSLPALLGIVWVGAVVLFNLWALGLDAFSGLTGSTADKIVTAIGVTSFMLLLWVGRSIAGLALMRWLLAGQLWRGAQIEIIAVVFGGAIGGVLVALPFIGWAIGVAASVIGIGALLLTLERREPARALYLPSDPAVDSLRLPPPVVDNPPTAPGMDNLPSGFTWWE